jgi:hypothetical protein
MLNDSEFSIEELEELVQEIGLKEVVELKTLELEEVERELKKLEDKTVHFFIKPISEALDLSEMTVPNLNQWLFKFHAQALRESKLKRLNKKGKFPSDDELALYWIELPVKLAFDLFRAILDVEDLKVFHEDIKISLLSCVLDPVFFDYIKTLPEEDQWALFYKALPVITYLSPLYLLPGVRTYLINKLRNNKDEKEKYLEKISDLLIKNLHLIPELRRQENLRRTHINFLSCLISLVANDVDSVGYFINEVKKKYNEYKSGKLEEINKLNKKSIRQGERVKLQRRDDIQEDFISNLSSYQQYIQPNHSDFNSDLFLIHLKKTEEENNQEADLKTILECKYFNIIRLITTIISFPEKTEKELTKKLTMVNYQVLFPNFGIYFNQCMGPLLAMTWCNSEIKNNSGFLQQLINTTLKHNVPNNFSKFVVFSCLENKEMLENMFNLLEGKSHNIRSMKKYLSNSLNILTPESSNSNSNFFNQTTDRHEHGNSSTESFQITHSI